MKTPQLFILFLLVSVSTNAQWMQAEGINGAPIGSVVATDNMLFCAATNIYRSPKDSISWEMITLQPYNLYSAGNCVFEVSPGLAFFAYRSLDNGETWQSVNFPQNTIGGLFATAGSSVFIAGYDTSSNNFVLRSDDYGMTWNNVFSWNNNVFKIFANDSNVFAAYIPGKIFYSNNLGNSWDSLPTSGLNNWLYQDIFKFHSEYWLTNYDGVFRFDNTLGQWIFQQSSPLYDYTVFQDDLYAIGQGIFLFDSVNNSWIPENNGLETAVVSCLFPTDSVFYCGTPIGPYRAADSLEWESVFNGLHGGYVTSMSCNENECWITTDLGVYKSLDNGHFFEKQETPDEYYFQRIIITDTTYYLSGRRSFYFSHDHGVTWQADTTGLPSNRNLTNMTVGCGEVFILCQKNYDTVEIFKSIPGYSNWESSQYNDPLLQNIAGSDSAIIVANGSSNLLPYPVKITYNKFLNVDTISAIQSGYYPGLKYSDSTFVIWKDFAIYYSEDNGITWEETDVTGVPLYNIAKKDDLIITGGSFCGSNSQVFASYDSGDNWSEITDNLASLGWMTCKDVNINGERVFLSTGELGIIYRDDIVTGIKTPLAAEKEKLFIYPNPSSDRITIRTEASFNGMITISDILGNIVFKDNKAVKNEFVVRDLKEGVYIVNLIDENRILTAKFIKTAN